LVTVNNIELRDETIYPDEKVLRRVLGASYSAYSLSLELFGKYGMTYEWRYYHDGKAWLCKVQLKKRTIIWMSAWKDFIKATIYFPEKYLQRVYSLDISEDVKKKIGLTKNVGTSKPCIFEIRDQKILTDLETVMKLKCECK
jgi:hypothetical protein